MKFSTPVLLLACATMVDAHGDMNEPKGPEGIINIACPRPDGGMYPHDDEWKEKNEQKCWSDGESLHWDSHWFTHGTMIGCEVATGVGCSPEKPCCDNPMKPTLKTIDQFTYASDEFMDAIKKIDESSKNKNLRHLSNPLGEFAKSLVSTTSSPLSYNSPLRFHPWYAPGHAPVADSCGVLGGWQYKNASDYYAGPGDAHHSYDVGTGVGLNVGVPRANMPVPAGTKGTAVLHSNINKRMQEAQGESYRTNDNPTWKVGSSQNVSWSVNANHGGGYQFRICPLEYLMNETIDEDCFQALDFVGDTAWFNYSTPNDPEGGTIPFTTKRVTDANTDGVLPKGSTWTTIGLPACSDCYGGGTFEYFDKSNTNKGDCDADAGYCKKPMFENELSDAGLWGYGFSSNGSPAFVDIIKNGDWEIVDTIKVPDGIEDGDYVFSWRWDSEASPQVWTSCAVVTIEA